MEYNFWYDNENAPVWEAGTKIQLIQEGIPRDGIVVESITPKLPMAEEYSDWAKLLEPEKGEMAHHTIVRWDSGEEELLPTEAIELKDSDIEREFRILCFGPEDVVKKIDEKLRAAAVALSEAEELSERYGIPFSGCISALSQNYTPESFIQKFSDLDSNFVDRVTGSYPSSYGGWEHSAIC